MSNLLKSEWTIFVAAILASILTAVLTFAHANSVLIFLISAVALATLATVVGHATEQLGNYLGPGPTGVLQASVASMPELFVSFFALRVGLVTVVQSAIVGSILANTLLIMGLAFLFGGLKNGTQRFGSEKPRAIVIMMVLAVSALVVPTLADAIHTPAEAHEEALSIASAFALLAVFAASVPFSWKGGPIAEKVPPEDQEGKPWPMSRAITILVIAGVVTAFVSEWFVSALEPTMLAWGISEAF